MANLIGGFQQPDINGQCRYHAPIDISKITPSLEPGIYKISDDYKGTYVTKEPLYTDSLISLNTSAPFVRLMKEVRGFLSPMALKMTKDFGLIHRRGFLLYGPPGSGKSSLINMVANELAATHGVITFLNPSPSEFSEIGKAIHDLNPNQFMLVVYEDFENWIDSTELLALLDGQKSVPNVIYIATTNYIEQLPERIINRPSRFATRIEVANPPVEVRYEFFKGHIPESYRTEIDLNVWAEATDGLMIDHLKHVVQYVFIFGHTLEEAVAILKASPVSEPIVVDDYEDEEN